MKKSIVLNEPSLKNEEAFLEWLKLAHEEDSYKFWDYEEVQKNFQSFVSGQIFKKGNCPISNVPESVFWAFINNKMIGRVSIRHALTEKLSQKGGHIGYQVSKLYRNKGYATQILQLALIEARKIGLEKVLLTTYPNNIPSQKVILKNGGVLTASEQNELLKYEIQLLNESDC